MVILSRTCHDLAMILASVPCIMISHDLGKGTMVNHDLARLTMIMASVPWLRTLGNQFIQLLIAVTKEEWDRIDAQFIKRLLASLPKRIESVIMAGGRTSSYWFLNFHFILFAQ